MREANAMLSFTVRSKAWDKFQLLLQTAQQEGCFIARWSKECTFVRNVCTFPRLDQNPWSLEAFTATVRKCTNLFPLKWPCILMSFNISAAHIFKNSEHYLPLMWTLKVYFSTMQSRALSADWKYWYLVDIALQQRAEEMTDPTYHLPKF